MTDHEHPTDVSAAEEAAQWGEGSAPVELPPCTRCGHSPDDHRVSSEAEVQDPTDDRTRFRCIEVGCECPNYEQWKRS